MEWLKVFICLSFQIFALQFEVTILTPKQDELETQLMGLSPIVMSLDWTDEWCF